MAGDARPLVSQLHCQTPPSSDTQQNKAAVTMGCLFAATAISVVLFPLQKPQSAVVIYTCFCCFLFYSSLLCNTLSSFLTENVSYFHFHVKVTDSHTSKGNISRDNM